MTELEHVIPNEGVSVDSLLTSNILPQGDDDELRVLRPILDIVRHDGHISEVQCGVYFVHEIQRRRLDTGV